MERPDDRSAYLHGLCAFRTHTTALRLRALVETSGSPGGAWHADDRLLERSGWSTHVVESFRAHREEWNLAAEYTRLEASGARLIPYDSPEYPRLLREIYDPPLALYVRGSLAPHAVPVAFVGSRKATPYGRSATHALVRPLAARGVTAVSGLAYGVDAEAHRAALAVHGSTIAVLGSGLDEASLYPRAHRGLAADIIAQGGAVVSEYTPGTLPRPEYFPQRNRIIAGLSHAVVVVEASATSGALITARLALSENRDVLVVPGPITSPLSEGTNRLLREGAAPATSAEDILEILALDLAPDPRVQQTIEPGTEQDRPAAEALDVKQQEPHHDHGGTRHPTHETILSLLSREPQSVDELVTASTLPTHEVIAALSLLELEGRARDIGGKTYVRV